MMASLRQRLVWILLGLTLLVWLSSALLTGVYASRVLIAQVDRQLEQYADLVSYITQVFARQVNEGLPLSEPWLGHLDDGVHRHPMTIETPQGATLTPALNVWHEDNLIAVLEASPHFDKPQEEGFSYRRVANNDRHWRVLSRYDESNGLWIMVGIELDAARWALLAMLGRALFPLLFILPLTIVLVYFGVSRGLLPLKALASQIARRNPRVLDPVDASAVPAELLPVVSALNSLLRRLVLALESEQRFTANAAHELMTPLAAIKTEVQLCQRQLQDGEAKVMLQRIALRVDRASHSVEQLLTLARVDPELPPPNTEVALRALLGEVLAETGHLAAERGLELRVDQGAEIWVHGNEEGLAILLRNLFINAFRYATEGTVVEVDLASTNSQIQLEICNDCEGLTAAEFARITERFYRVPGSAGLGAGLGLSIVKRIANAHGARFTAQPGADGGGFCARIEMPVVAPKVGR